MSRLRTRLKRLEKQESVRACAACAVRQQTMHTEYALADGQVITLPSFPEWPSCTCGRSDKEVDIVAIVVRHSGVMANREDAERHYAEHTLPNWQQLSVTLPGNASDKGDKR